jgi:dienelactone hydrolase
MSPASAQYGAGHTLTQRHAFARHNGAHYNAAAAALANERTSEFLHKQLQ